jgi:hypothetical protein
MAKNRSLYNALAVYASQAVNSTGSGSHYHLKRVQSYGWSDEIARTDVLQLGELSRVGSIVTSPPTVSFDLSYILTDGEVERALGFYVQNPNSLSQANFASGHAVTSSGINLYVVEASEGIDINNETSLSGKAVLGIGNCFLNNYSLEAAVGSFPTVSVSFDAANINGDLYYHQGAVTGTNSPAVDLVNGQALAQNTGVRLPLPTTGTGPIALRPGDISITWGNLTGTASGLASPMHNLNGIDGIRVQNLSLSLPLSRTPIEQLGSRFPFARPVDFPVTATLSVSAIANEQVKRNLAAYLDDTSTNDITININQPNGAAAMIYTLKGCQFDSESSSVDIGSNRTVDLTFSAQLGAPNTTNKGVFVSGSSSNAVFS